MQDPDDEQEPLVVPVVPWLTGDDRQAALTESIPLPAPAVRVG